MSAYTIVDDATGEIVSLVDMPDLQSVEFNTPAGASAIKGWPEHKECYRLSGQWVQKPIAPTPGHSWDTTSKTWVDLRTPEALVATARGERDRRLAECDWIVARALESGEQVPALWRAYREGLRDLPSQPGFPLSIDWPVMPG